MSRLSPARLEAERAEAEVYARAIAESLKATDWSRWNSEIIARWSLSALIRIKTRAWQIVESEGRVR